MSLLLVVVSVFECGKNVLYFVLSTAPIFLNTKTNDVTNLNFLIQYF